MSRRADWIWGTLTPAHRAHAEACVQQIARNVEALNLGPNPRYTHTPDQHYQRLLGMEGEIMFRVLTGRPLPSVTAMANTWKGADVDGYAVKTVSGVEYRLLFHEGDLASAHTLVLMFNRRPRTSTQVAIVGRIAVARARELRYWAEDLPHPSWAVEQDPLDPWDPDDDF